jgi:hypothetical protein
MASSRARVKSIASGNVATNAAANPQASACSAQTRSTTVQNPCHGSGSVRETGRDQGGAGGHLFGERRGDQRLPGREAAVQDGRADTRAATA